MFNTQLQILKTLQNDLENIGYPDSYRIAREIYQYSEGDPQVIVETIARLRQNTPWEYVKESSEFKGYDFIVNPSVLIPRIETEQLVDIAAKILREDTKINHIVDVGTGSGAIICSLFKELNNKALKYTASDISTDALKTAKKNAAKLDIKEINFIETNLAKDINIDQHTLVIANLPYIPTDTYMKLDPSVKDFEPRIALDGGRKGVDQIQELFKQLLLSPALPKYILLEIDAEILPDVKLTIKSKTTKYSMETVEDYRKQIRFVICSLTA
ncbi:MAG: N5-glutamine S-adenosyl-L-methionine-dependent methyltransferase [candidate division WS6 bacterium GW2011_GWF2_39_15]|uniref:N5-glutamine S-adenosyl-L-methionine-dependent methyltransferase n=1 Tax=candidate division WS6 bacterium GW2011_GWF2_39_15 TaxID=1619100 RepID=A0A0G0QXG3_9BACT|nr:MAG: N5-glutamine S-adenosyl-L-methionine-dependent methyltransferase [candidate division WS6 bacterium GW2011_GWF2_39_15]